MPNVQQMIEDFIKGARMGHGFMRNGQVGVEMQTLGQETKLAEISPGGASLLGSMVPLPFASPIAAGMAADKGHGWGAAGGSLLGGGVGALAGGAGGAGLGALIGLLAKNPALGALIGGGVGAGAGNLAGKYYGANAGGDYKESALKDIYHEGFKAACERFKVSGLMGNPLVQGGLQQAGGLLVGSIADKFKRKPPVPSVG